MEHSNKLFRERGLEMCDDNLVVVAGPPGSGKTSITKQLEESLYIKNVVSSTTRKPRPKEVDGIDYHFFSHKEFLLRHDDGEFLESAEYEGNLYGTRFEDLREALDSGSLVLLVVEMKGVVSILRVYPGAQTFFVTAPKEQLIRRLNERDADKEECKKRIAGLDQELTGEHSSLIKCLVQNHDGHFDEAVQKMRSEILKVAGYSFMRKLLQI
jgi:guanylate kinase